MALNINREESKSNFSDDLYDALIVKNTSEFWKTWKSKFGVKSSQAKIVEGCSSSSGIAQAFKGYFSQICVPNNASVHSFHKINFWRDYEKYANMEDSNDLFSVGDIEIALNKLKKGK